MALVTFHTLLVNFTGGRWLPSHLGTTILSPQIPRFSTHTAYQAPPHFPFPISGSAPDPGTQTTPDAETHD